MAKIFIFDFDIEKVCIDLDTVSMISFKKEKVKITFKNTHEILELKIDTDDQEVQIKLMDSYTKLIDFWRQ